MRAAGGRKHIDQEVVGVRRRDPLPVRRPPHVLALGAHAHKGEKISLEIGGVQTRFEQSPAVVGSSPIGPLTFSTGFTVYTIRRGVIDAGQFVPIVTRR